MTTHRKLDGIDTMSSHEDRPGFNIRKTRKNGHYEISDCDSDHEAGRQGPGDVQAVVEIKGSTAVAHAYRRHAKLRVYREDKGFVRHSLMSPNIRAVFSCAQMIDAKVVRLIDSGGRLLAGEPA